MSSPLIRLYTGGVERVVFKLLIDTVISLPECQARSDERREALIQQEKLREEATARRDRERCEARRVIATALMAAFAAIGAAVIGLLGKK